MPRSVVWRSPMFNVLRSRHSINLPLCLTSPPAPYLRIHNQLHALTRITVLTIAEARNEMQVRTYPGKLPFLMGRLSHWSTHPAFLNTLIRHFKRKTQSVVIPCWRYFNQRDVYTICSHVKWMAERSMFRELGCSELQDRTIATSVHGTRFALSTSSPTASERKQCWH